MKNIVNEKDYLIQMDEKNTKLGVIWTILLFFFFLFLIIIGIFLKEVESEAYTFTEPQRAMVYKISEDEVLNVLHTGTGILYFTWKDCPYCKELTPYLLEIALSKEIPLYYFDAYDIRDKKELNEDGEVEVVKEGTPVYNQLLFDLKDYLPAYEGLNDERIKRIYFPTTVFLKDGQIIDVLIDTWEGYEDPNKSLSEKQQKELVEYLGKEVHKIKTKTCSANGC